jgi:hypothetical protein
VNGKQLQLIEQLSKKKETSHIYMRRDGVSLTLGKSSASNNLVQ